MKIKTSLQQILVINIALLLCSCGWYSGFKNDYQQPKVRFVNMQGEVKKVELKTPTQNYEALAKQGELTTHTQPQAKIEAKQVSSNKYVQNDPQNALTNTINMPIDKTQAITQERNLKDSAQNVVQEIEYDLGKEKPAKPAKTIKVQKKQEVIYKNTRKKTYVQAGSFRTIYKAKQQKTKISKIVANQAKISIKNAKVRGKTYHRIVIGPYKSKKAARAMIKKLKTKGQDSILVKIR